MSSVMNWSLATNKQLNVIITHEYDCSPELLRGAVLEMLNRGLFDRVISRVVHLITCNVRKTAQIHGYAIEDFLQLGRMEVLAAIEKFDPTKENNFMSFLYMKVKNIVIQKMQYLEAQMRDNRLVESYNIELEDGTEVVEFINDNKTNVEKYVIDKLTVEQLLVRLNPHQRKIILYRMQGYKFEEISEMLGRGSMKSMSQAYRLGIKKMRMGA